MVAAALLLLLAALLHPTLARASGATPAGASISASQASGIDVSSIQHAGGPIIWTSVAAGYQFVYVKASESNDYVNPYYQSDFSSALGQGMYVGGYAFGRPDALSGAAEAAYFLQTSGYAMGPRVLAPMIDMESDPYNTGTPCYGLSQPAMVAWIEDYSNTIRAQVGRLPVLYTAAGWWDQCTGGSSALANDPLWIASYGTSTPTMPSGFPTWALWQYGIGSASGIAGSTDLDVFAGSVQVLDSQLTDDGGTVPLTESDATQSEVYDPISGNLEIYARSNAGSLVEDYWSPASGWSGWFDLGGSITNSPAAVYDPTTKRMDVFVRSNAGTLSLRSWSPSTNWTATDLGGDLIGSPNAVSDPSNGNLEVYVEGAAGDLEETYESGGRWIGWGSLGGSIVATPEPIYNPQQRHIEVYAEGNRSQLAELWWAPATGWSSWLDLGGSVVGQPSAISDGANGNLEVYVTTAGAALQEIYFSAGTAAWIGWLGLGGVVVGSPSAIFNPQQSHPEIYVQGSDHALYERWWGPAAGWSGWAGLGGSLANRPTAMSDPINGNLEVYATAPGNVLDERYYSAATGAWGGWLSLGGNLI